MAHWSDAYIGKPYSRRYNCAALAADVAFNELGVKTRLPRNLTNSPDEQADIIKSHLNSFVIPAEHPIDKGVILMKGRGVPCHIGVICLIAHIYYVLHADSDFGSVIRQRLSDIKLDYEIEGYYEWKI